MALVLGGVALNDFVEAGDARPAVHNPTGHTHDPGHTHDLAHTHDPTGNTRGTTAQADSGLGRAGETPRTGLSAAVGLPVPAAARAAERIPAVELAALEVLSTSRPPLEGEPEGHVHSLDNSITEPALPPDIQRRLDEQWALAVEVSERLGSVEAARSAGYVQAAAAVPGVGEHWIKWSLVDRAFDPAHPSMILFQQVGDTEHKRLVGLSYWVYSAAEPDGFAGPADRWHRHFGLCFENGWLTSQGIADPSECHGHWVNGSDLWMLHAWTVPDLDNTDGRFAEVNRRLCPSPMGRPDIATCDPLLS